MSAANNGGLARRLNLFSKLSIISSYECDFHMYEQNFLQNFLLIFPTIRPENR
jgi:hypothetical protein